MNDKVYLFAPQWQDSGNTKELYAGAQALKSYFKSISNEPLSEVEIKDSQTSIVKNNILAYDLLSEQLADIGTTLERSGAKKVAVLGGGCGLEVPIVSYVLNKNPSLQLVWFDAHGDLNSPESSPSKHFHGMPLRFLIERQKTSLGSEFNILPASSLCLIGARDLDPPESDFIERKNLKLVRLSSNYWAEILAQLKPGLPTYIHIDLDVLDPAEYPGVKCPVEKGLSFVELEKTLDHLLLKTEVLGMSLVENTETDLSKIQKLHGLFKRFLQF